MEEELKNRIRTESLRMFMSLGVRSVTMDDVARELAVSKKTLYQFVSNKAELVEESFRYLMKQVVPEVRKIRQMGGNAIDHMFMLDDFMCSMVESHNPATKFQLQRYYPATWKAMDETRFTEFIETIGDNLDRGIKEGLYRADINPKLIAYMYYGKAEMMTDTQWFPTDEYDMTEISHVSLEYHLRGICSQKGLDYLDKLIQEKKWKH